MDMNTPHSRSSMQAGLEVVPPETGLYPLPTPTPFYAAPQETSPQATSPQDPSPSPKEQPADVESRGQQPTPNQTEAQTPGSSQKGRRILGLSIPVFWAVIVTLVVVLAAAIGGGVGGGLSAQRQSVSGSSASSSGDTSNTSSSSSGASTPTAATSSSATPSPTASSSSDDSLVPTDGCPGVDGVAYTAYSADGKTIPLRAGGAAQEFKEQCWTNWANTDSTHDILRTYTPTLENCLVVCAEYNKAYLTNLDSGTGVGGGPCVAVTIVKEHAGFCFLKNGTGTNDTMGNPQMYSSAVLITSMDD